MEKNETTKAYSKPVVLAANNPQGSFAAGCPAKEHHGFSGDCKKCELRK